MRGGFSGASPHVVPVLLAIVATRVAHELNLGNGVDWEAATDKVSTLRQSTGLGAAGSEAPRSSWRSTDCRSRGSHPTVT
jgi:hypothetical protein